MAYRVGITGWTEGLQKISLTHELQASLGLGLAAAKSITDRVLAGELVVFEQPSRAAAEQFAGRLSALGASTELSEVEPDVSHSARPVSEAELVHNADALIQIFGRWPSFHDAEVLSIYLDRSGEDGPIIEARVHVFRMTDQVDARGYFVLTNHSLVTLRCENVLLRELRWFNSQNVLSGLGIEAIDPDANEGRTIGVSFDASYGLEADLLCSKISVCSVEPFSPAV